MPIAPFQLVERKNADGSVSVGVEIREKKKHVSGYWLTPDRNPLSLAGNAQTQLRFEVDNQGHFDWAYIMGLSSLDYSIEFFDGGRNKRLQNAPIFNQLIVGNAYRPFMLPKPYFIDVGNSKREIIATVRNLAGTTNTIRLILYGRRFYHKEMPPQLAQEVSREAMDRGEDYSYFLLPKETTPAGDLANVAVNGTFKLTFEADDDANIEIQKIIGSAAFGTNFDQVMIRERDTNRGIISDIAVADMIATSSIALRPSFPIYLPDSYLLERKKQLIVTGRNVGAEPAKPFMMMAGRRYQKR